MEEIELRGGFTQEFDKNLVEDVLTKIDNTIEDANLLTIENFQLKMRLFLKLSKELSKLHTVSQTGNYFTNGSWHYKGESLSRRA